MSDPVLIPCDGAEYPEMATLLLAVAREIGIPTGRVRLVYNGFEVPQELLDAWNPQPIASRQTVDENDGGAVTPELDDDADRVVAEMVVPKRRGRPPGRAKQTTEV